MISKGLARGPARPIAFFLFEIYPHGLKQLDQTYNVFGSCCRQMYMDI